MAMTTSQNGINLIKQFEGFRAVPYKDIAGFPTIGYGHLIQPGEVFGAVSSVDATTLLITDLATAEICINTYVTTTINQNQFDALASFVYNLGCGKLKMSTLLKLINAGELELAADEFLKWNHAGGAVVKGLTERRKAERDLFLSDNDPISIGVAT